MYLLILEQDQPRINASYISILKWSLLSNIQTEKDSFQISFGQADVEALVSCHVPITLTSRSDDFVEQLLPLVLKLDGPLGNYSFIKNLRGLLTVFW